MSPTQQYIHHSVYYVTKLLKVKNSIWLKQRSGSSINKSDGAWLQFIRFVEYKTSEQASLEAVETIWIY